MAELYKRKTARMLLWRFVHSIRTTHPRNQLRDDPTELGWRCGSCGKYLGTSLMGADARVRTRIGFPPVSR